MMYIIMKSCVLSKVWLFIVICLFVEKGVILEILIVELIGKLVVEVSIKVFLKGIVEEID